MMIYYTFLMIDDDIYVLCLIDKQPLQNSVNKTNEVMSFRKSILFATKRKSDELNRETNWNF